METPKEPEVMSINPEIASYNIYEDKIINLKGGLIKDLKGKKAILKAWTDEDILEIKQMLCDEIKKQKEGEAEHE